jgi:hypothetical protein
MTDSRKHPLTRWIAEIESVKLTNALIALTVRLVASTVLGTARLVRRRRSRW